jgi:hypothetical protein
VAVSRREERLAENEILFRHVNEQIVELVDKWGGSLDLVCECADLECTARIELTLREYEDVRQNAHHFIILPGQRSLRSKMSSSATSATSLSKSMLRRMIRWRPPTRAPDRLLLPAFAGG